MCVTSSCDCDYVEVYDNFPDGKSVLVGKYCMGVAYPYGDIKSSSNNVTVIFRSDFTVGAAGFKALYQAIQVTGKDCNLVFIYINRNLDISFTPWCESSFIYF